MDYTAAARVHSEEISSSIVELTMRLPPHRSVAARATPTSPTRAQGEARARVGREVGRPQRQRREDGRVRGRHGHGRRIAKRINGTIVRRWLYKDSLKPIAELDGAGALVSSFVYASNPLVPDFVIRGGTTYRIVSDQLGSPRLVVDVATGAVAQRLRHDEFGNVLEDTAPGFVPFGFAGGVYDADTGLVRFGVRDYDASVGRWVSKDPLRFESGDAPNLYLYVNGDPVNYADSTGRQAIPIPIPWGPVIGLGAAAGALACYLSPECSAYFAKKWPLDGTCGPKPADQTKSDDELIKGCQQHASAAQAACTAQGLPLSVCLNVYLRALQNCIENGGRGNFY